MKKAAKHREKSIKNIFLLKTNPYFLEPTCGLEKLKHFNQINLSDLKMIKHIPMQLCKYMTFNLFVKLFL